MEKDFDFEKELGFDPNAFLDGDDFDGDIDLSEFSDEELGLSTPEAKTGPEEEDDLDLSQLDALLGDLEEPAFQEPVPEEPAEEEPAPEDETFDLDFEEDFDAEFRNAFLDQPEEYPQADEPEDEEDIPEEMFRQRQAYQKEPQEDTPETFQDENLEEADPAPQIDEADEAEESEADEQPARRRRERKPRQPKPPKEHKPNVFTKLFDLYFGPVMDKEQFQQIVSDPTKPRRRRKSKQQIFKEVYLPPIIACVALILVMTFVIGSISNAIDQKRLTDKQKENEIQASISQAQEDEQEYARVVAQAEALAAGYDYESAAKVLESYSGYADSVELQNKRASYITALDSMVEYKDPSAMPNLSFQPLVVDMTKALADADYGASYNKNFVTTAEFSNILQQLYDGGYILVDFNSFTAVSQTVDGNDQFNSVSILLPQGKKPIMITETMVCYYQYMIDSGAFASRLVVDGSGDIKAEYVDASGTTLTGNYDLVPILEDFIAQHPDFSYKGARAILATTGDEGIFGYRCNSDYAADKGNDYYEQQKAGATTIVNALKDKGYTLACYTYANDDYNKLNANQISSNIQSWVKQITPVIGQIDTFVFAKGTDMSDYSGTAFKAMYQAGFRYFVASGKTPSTTVNNTYVHQNRLMVTGEYMRHYSDRFTDYFDSNIALDLSVRGGEVPKSG